MDPLGEEGDRVYEDGDEEVSPAVPHITELDYNERISGVPIQQLKISALLTK